MFLFVCEKIHTQYIFMLCVNYSEIEQIYDY